MFIKSGGKIPKKYISQFDDGVQNAYNKYSKNGWTGQYGPDGPSYAGKKFKNSDSLLPTKDTAGNSITYKEFDVYKVTPRDANRFFVGSNGKVYFTNDHYSTFTLIE